MARKLNQYVEVSGGIFEPDAAKRMRDAAAKGIQHLGDEATGIMMGFISEGGFVKTGAFLQSTNSKFVRPSTDYIGFALVRPTDSWTGASGRPTRTWAERGTRRGVKLRKGLGIFRKTQNRMKDFSVENIAAAISRVLD